jgi:hypothetical protein
VTNHPNAVAAGAAFTPISLLVVWLAGRFGVADFGAEEGVIVAGGITTVGLFIGRKGVRGVARIFWRGSE